LIKHTLTAFIGKRAIICYVLVSIIVITVIDKRWATFAGFTIGAILSMMQLSSNVSMFERVLSKETPKHAAKKSYLHFILALLSILAVLVAAITYDIWLFAGAVAGILVVPFVICINGLTEGLGITHNNFE